MRTLYDIGVERRPDMADPVGSVVYCRCRWAHYEVYRSIGAHEEGAAVDVFRMTFGHTLEGLQRLRFTHKEVRDTMHRIQARLDAAVTEYLHNVNGASRHVRTPAMDYDVRVEGMDLAADVPAADRDAMTAWMIQHSRAEIQRLMGMDPRAPYSEGISREAIGRAKKLLVRNLSAAQRLDFERTGGFDVRTRAGVRFRIENLPTFNVIAVVSGLRYCTSSAEPVPIYDMMLAQKLMLEADVASFFAVANCSDGLVRPRLEIRRPRLFEPWQI